MHATISITKLPNKQYSTDVSIFMRDGRCIKNTLTKPFVYNRDFAMNLGICEADEDLVVYTTHNGFSCYDF